MARRVDANQVAIVQVLRSAGAAVLDMHELGKGAPDILACWHGDLMLIECKSERGTLTPAEAAFHAKWPGVIHIVRSVDDALELLRAVE